MKDYGSSETWRTVFQQWPPAMPKQGVLVTNFGESINFVNFLVSNTAIIAERDKPDAIGARKVLVDFGSILALKLADAGELARYQTLGFR